MDLTPASVARQADAYESVQPLAAVEAEHREMLPGTLADGEFGWRDAEWVVQWFYRRYLGTYPDADRGAAEERYGQNSYEDVRDAIADAVAADGAPAKLEPLTALSGVDVPVGSAFLAFLDPDRYLVVSRREWETLRAVGELDGASPGSPAVAYPDPPAVEDYERYLRTCRGVAERCDCTLWTLYRALWTIGSERED